MLRKWIGLACLGALLAGIVPWAEADEAAPLTIDRFWHPDPTGGPPIIINSLEDAPDGFWVLLGAGVDTLYRIRADTLVGTATPALPQFNSATLLVTPQALYVVAAHRMADESKSISLHRYDIAAGAWESRDADGISRLFAVGDRLYFTFNDSSSGGREAAIGSYDWATGQKTVLASNRRVPPQTQFDAKPNFRSQVFAGPGVKPCALIDYVPYFISEQPGDWLPVFHFNVFYEPDSLRTLSGRTVLAGAIGSHGNPSMAVTAMDAVRDEPEEYLGTPQPLPPDARSPATPPAPTTPGPTWARQPVWPGDYPYGKRHDFATHGDDLFAFTGVREGGTRYHLLWFRRGKPDPIRIPLHFVLDEATKALLPALCNNLAPMVADVETAQIPINFASTSQGLCFKPIAGGFWFLSYADLDAYAAGSAARTRE